MGLGMGREIKGFCKKNIAHTWGENEKLVTNGLDCGLIEQNI